MKVMLESHICARHMRAICINLINLTTKMAIVVSGGNDDDNEDEDGDGNEMSALCKVVAK